MNDNGHLVDLPVAAHAPYSAPHVRGVIEEDVIGRLVHPDPGNWLSALEARLHERELGAVSLDRLVAVHARLGGRDLGDRRFFDARVTVKTGQAELPGMLSVRERHR